jgi:hypothetical protein
MRSNKGLRDLDRLLLWATAVQGQSGKAKKLAKATGYAKELI